MTDLLPIERDRLAELEAVVYRGLQTFVEVGRALTEIRDSRLYRATHSTFEDYLDARWQMSRSRGYQLIEAADAVDLVSTTVDIAPPTNEAQARELVPLVRDDEHQAVDLWRDLRAEHGDRLTAAKVREAVDMRMRRDKLIGAVTSSDTYEWYTPSEYVEAARRVLGTIDLDPASCAQANETVRAARYYDIHTDGLTQPWHGRVFLNPPYAHWTSRFVAKLLDELRAGRVHAAVVVLNAYGFDADWFQPLAAGVLCLTNHRIAFPYREKTGGSTFGSAFVYLGPDRARFAREFLRFGNVWFPPELEEAAAA